jgi:hypothetical protein
MPDLVTGHSCTGILHFFNQTPVDWFSKRQNQVETATYGSEFMAARQAVEQIIDLRYTLQMLGVPIDGPTWLFGDNKSVVTSSTMPYSRLSVQALERPVLPPRPRSFRRWYYSL